MNNKPSEYLDSNVSVSTQKSYSRNIFSNYIFCLKNTFTFQGRMTRGNYWKFAIPTSILFTFTVMITGLLPFLGILTLPAIIILGLSWLSATVRRLHDMNKTAWWTLLIFIIFVGEIILAIMMLFDSKEPNDYGDEPLY